MKLIIKLFALLAISALPAAAQFTSVTATVKDSNNTLYTKGSYSISFVGAGNAMLGSFGLFPRNVVGTLDSSANMAITLADNNQVTPAGSQWQFDICDSTDRKSTRLNS